MQECRFELFWIRSKRWIRWGSSYLQDLWNSF